MPVEVHLRHADCPVEYLVQLCLVVELREFGFGWLKLNSYFLSCLFVLGCSSVIHMSTHIVRHLKFEFLSDLQKSTEMAKLLDDKAFQAIFGVPDIKLSFLRVNSTGERYCGEHALTAVDFSESSGAHLLDHFVLAIDNDIHLSPTSAHR